MILTTRSKFLFFSLLFLFTILIGYSVTINPILTMAIPLILFFGILVLIKTKAAFELTLIGMFSIPAKCYEFFHLNVPYINNDVFNLMLISISLVLIIKRLASKKFTIASVGLSFFILIFTLIAYWFIGYQNKNDALIADVKIYIWLPLIFIMGITFYSNKAEAIKSFIKLVVTSSFFLSIISISIYFFKDSVFHSIFLGSFDVNNSRVGFSNHSNFAFAIPLIILTFRVKLLRRSWTPFTILTLLLMCLTLILGQSRSLIIAVIINSVVVTFYATYFYNKKPKIVKTIKLMYISFFIIICFYGVFSLPFVSGNTSSVIDRFNDMFSSGGSIETLVTRQDANQYYFNLIQQNIWGYGMGKKMYLINHYTGELGQEGLNIDNGFITFTYKFGILGIIAWVIFYFRNTLHIYKHYKHNKNSIEGKFAISVLLCLPMVMINAMYFTAQLVMSEAVFSFTLVLMALFYNKNKTNEGAIK